MNKRTLSCLIGIMGLAVSVASAHTDKCNLDEHNPDNAKYVVGAQVRLRGDFVRNQNLGDFSFSPGTHDEQFLSRTRLHLLVEPISQLKAFIEGQLYARKDHSDYSRGNIYQAYLEISDIKNIPIELKVGRQELEYGSGFFMGCNDFYEGLVWDGLKARIKVMDNLWADLICLRYVNLDKHTSSDEPALYGIYSGYELARDMALEGYLFYHKGGFSFFHSGLPDNQKWYTVGARLAGKLYDRFDYEIEPIYQFGSIDNLGSRDRDRISAYGGHIETGYTFDLKYKPRLFAGYAMGSGDNDTGDKRYREFHGNIHNDSYVVGDMSVIADVSGLTVGGIRASGMHVMLGGLSADLTPKLNLNIDYHYFIADKTLDSISKYLGGEVNLIAGYKLFKNLNIIASANRFFTGSFFKNAVDSTKDISYYYIQTQIEF